MRITIYSENTCGNNRSQIQDSGWLWDQGKEMQLRSVQGASTGFVIFFLAEYSCLGVHYKHIL